MRLPHNDCSISRPFYGHCTGTVRQPSDSCTIIPRFCDFFDQLKSCVLHMITMRPPCYGCNGIVQCFYHVSTGYGLAIFFLMQLNKIVKATATLWHPRNHTISCDVEAAPKWDFRHHTGAVSSSQAKCKLGITVSLSCN